MQLTKYPYKLFLNHILTGADALAAPAGRNNASMNSEEDKSKIVNAPGSVENGNRKPILPAKDAIARLWIALHDHLKLQSPVPHRTARLVSAGEPKMAQKLVEEAGEVAVAAMLGDRTEVIRESADLVYHLTILWAALGIKPEQVWVEMNQRESVYGIAEKRIKPQRTQGDGGVGV